MEVPPRHYIVEAAKKDFFSVILEWQDRHDITQAEGAEIQADALAHSLKWIVRTEREGGIKTCNKCGEDDTVDSDGLCPSCADELEAALAKDD